MHSHDEDPRVVDMLRRVPEDLRNQPFYLGQKPADKAGALTASRAIRKHLNLNAGRGKLYRIIDEGTAGVRLQAGDDGDLYTSLRWYAQWTVEVADARRAQREERRRELIEKQETMRREQDRQNAEDEAILAECGIGQKNTARPKTGRAARDDNSSTTKPKESTRAR